MVLSELDGNLISSIAAALGKIFMYHLFVAGLTFRVCIGIMHMAASSCHGGDGWRYKANGSEKFDV